MPETLDISIPINFVTKAANAQAVNSASAQTGDAGIIAIMLCLALGLLVACVSVFAFKYAKNRQLVSCGNHASKSLNNNPLQGISKISIVLFAMLLIAGVMLIGVSVAHAAENAIKVVNSQGVTAVIDEETGTVEIENCFVQNVDDKNLEIAAAAVNITDECKSLVNAENIMFTVTGDGNTLFSGNPGPDFKDLENPFAFDVNETKELGLNMNNSNPKENLNLAGHTAFVVSFKVAIGKHTVTFDTKGGIPAIEGMIVEHGAIISEPEDEITREGYEFQGWFADEDCTEAFDFTQPIMSDVIIYAGWDGITVEVEFDPQNTGDHEWINQKFGSPYILPETPIHPDGLSFKGWNTASDGTGDMIDDESTVNIPGFHTLYAIWGYETITATLALHYNFEYADDPVKPVFVDGDGNTVTTIEIDKGSTPVWEPSTTSSVYPTGKLTYKENGVEKYINPESEEYMGHYGFVGGTELGTVESGPLTIDIYFNRFLSTYSLPELKAISTSLANNEAKWYDEFYNYVNNAFLKTIQDPQLGEGFLIPADNGNKDALSIEDPQHHVDINGTIFRIIGINHDPTNNETGLTFMSACTFGDKIAFNDLNINPNPTIYKDYAQSYVANLLLDFDDPSFMKQINKKYSIEGSEEKSISCKSFVLLYKEITGLSKMGEDDGIYYNCFGAVASQDDSLKGIGTGYRTASQDSPYKDRGWTRTFYDSDRILLFKNDGSCTSAFNIVGDSKGFVIPCFCMGDWSE